MVLCRERSAGDHKLHQHRLLVCVVNQGAIHYLINHTCSVTCLCLMTALSSKHIRRQAAMHMQKGIKRLLVVMIVRSELLPIAMSWLAHSVPLALFSSLEQRTGVVISGAPV